MADGPGRGGYRRPEAPAPVSGPGRLAKRTDGGPAQTTVPMTGMAYGENADFNDVQSSAPLAAAPTVSNTRARKNSPAGQRAAATPLFAETARPEEPVTAGAPFGPGPGPQQTADAQLNRDSLSSIYSRMVGNDPTGEAQYFLSLALRMGL